MQNFLLRVLTIILRDSQFFIGEDTYPLDPTKSACDIADHDLSPTIYLLIDGRGGEKEINLIVFSSIYVVDTY